MHPVERSDKTIEPTAYDSLMLQSFIMKVKDDRKGKLAASKRLRRSHIYSVPATSVGGGESIGYDDIVIGEKIGSGFFGDVFKATVKPTGLPIVLKTMKPQDKNDILSDTHEKKFVDEILTMRSLSHRNVLKYVGAFCRENRFNLLAEYIPGGDLNDLIESKTEPFPWDVRLSISADVARGMEYLHSKGITHRDLNPNNILLKENKTAVVADFGLVAVVGRSRRRMSESVGSAFWMAPEMLLGLCYDQSVDVFAFGVTMAQIATRLSADPDVGVPRTARFGIDRQKLEKLAMKLNTPISYLRIIFLCCDVPKLRPAFPFVRGWLSDILTALKNVMFKTSNSVRSADAALEDPGFISVQRKILQNILKFNPDAKPKPKAELSRKAEKLVVRKCKSLN